VVTALRLVRSVGPGIGQARTSILRLYGYVTIWALGPPFIIVTILFMRLAGRLSAALLETLDETGYQSGNRREEGTSMGLLTSCTSTTVH
jgi:hypothetical protein